MFLRSSVLICLFGTLVAREPDIDINRVKFLPKEESYSHHFNSHERRSVEAHLIRSNDYDDHSSGLVEPRAPIHLLDVTRAPTTTKAPIAVHQPREDPRLFYQSDLYLKETNGQNVDRGISFIYPGREVVRASEGPKLLPLREVPREHNMIRKDPNICVRCPHDRTVIAKAGANRVVLQNPRLFLCSGQKASKNVRFIHMYGPKFGSLLERGSHMVVGRITFKGKTQHLCKLQIHVVTQVSHTCPTPNYLVNHCENGNRFCNFTCRDSRHQLHGEPSLYCGYDMNWMGELPVCRVRTWCEQPQPPEHGRLSCKGDTAGSGLVEGSKCRVRCARGWRWTSRGVAVCRRGSWTANLSCQPKRNQ